MTRQIENVRADLRRVHSAALLAKIEPAEATLTGVVGLLACISARLETLDERLSALEARL